jgi:hypothetical protein
VQAINALAGEFLPRTMHLVKNAAAQLAAI